MKESIYNTRLLYHLVFIFILFNGLVTHAQISPRYSSSVPWHQLGTIYLNAGFQKHTIKVGTGNAYQTIKITVTDVPTELIDIVIIYNNGEQSKISVRSVIHANESREFNLTKKQSINRIEMNYNAIPRNGKLANVSIWGI